MFTKNLLKKILKKISNELKYIIRKTIEEKLITDPLKFGLPLRRNLKSYMKLRVGNYRVIYSISKITVTVHVIKIEHRKDIYEITQEQSESLRNNSTLRLILQII